MRLVTKEQATEIRNVQASEEFQDVAYDMATIDRDSNDVRIAVIGNVDSGKSTMVGVMTKSIMDDGRGSARQKVFNFSHEAANGRTSSIGQEIMGFDDENNQVTMEHMDSFGTQLHRCNLCVVVARSMVRWRLLAANDPAIGHNHETAR